MSGRTIAIGDIHGCSTALRALVEAISPQGDDLIVALGDYINRGPDTRGVIEQLINLAECCRLTPLLGNHEQSLFEALAGIHPLTWIGMGGTATLDSYGMGRSLSLIPAQHIEFLEGCRDSFETESHIFVHANYHSEIPLREQPPLMLRWEFLTETMPDRHCSGKTAIVGHTSQTSGKILDLGYLKCIDTNCCRGGWLTALDVMTGQVWQANQSGCLRGNQTDKWTP